MSAPAPERHRPDPATKPRRTRRRSRTGVLGPSLYGVLAVLAAAPIVFIVLAAFSSEAPRPGSSWWTQLTFDNLSVLTSPEALTALGGSALVGVSASLLALVIGCGLAFLAARSDIRMRRTVFFIGLAPLFLPSLVGALAWSLLAGPASGLLNMVLDAARLPMTLNIYSTPGLIFVLGVYYAPYVFLMVHGALSLMNPELEEAAIIHGSSPARAVLRVTFPMAMPAILGSGILVFALTVENFPVAQVIGTPGRVDTLPTYIFRLMSASPSRDNEAAAMSIALILVVLVVTLLQLRAISRRNFTTVAGKGVKPRVIRLGRWRTPALIAVGVYFLLSVVLPVLALLIVSMQTSLYTSDLSDFLEPGAFSLASLIETAQDSAFLSALLNSTVIGASAALAGTVLSFALGYAVYRRRVPGRMGLEALAMAPLAIPAIVLGLGLLWMWLAVPLPVYGTALVLVLAFLTVFLPQGYRSVSGSITQLGDDLEDSAIMLGANRLRSIVEVTLPLMRVGITSTFLLLLMLCMRELSVALFLFTTDTRLLSILIFDSYDNGTLQEAASVSLLYCGVVLVMALGARALGARDIGKKL